MQRIIDHRNFKRQSTKATQRRLPSSCKFTQNLRCSKPTEPGSSSQRRSRKSARRFSDIFEGKEIFHLRRFPAPSPSLWIRIHDPPGAILKRRDTILKHRNVKLEHRKAILKRHNRILKRWNGTLKHLNVIPKRSNVLRFRRIAPQVPDSKRIR